MVTLCAVSEATKLPLATGTAVPEARLSLAEVTHGTICAGHDEPCTKSGTVVAPPVLMATMASVQSDGFWNAMTDTPEGGFESGDVDSGKTGPDEPAEVSHDP